MKASEYIKQHGDFEIVNEIKLLSEIKLLVEAIDRLTEELKEINATKRRAERRADYLNSLRRGIGYGR